MGIGGRRKGRKRKGKWGKGKEGIGEDLLFFFVIQKTRLRRR